MSYIFSRMLTSAQEAAVTAAYTPPYNKYVIKLTDAGLDPISFIAWTEARWLKVIREDFNGVEGRRIKNEGEQPQELNLE